MIVIKYIFVLYAFDIMDVNAFLYSWLNFKKFNFD
jgi:hypothetical protein